MRRKNVNMLEGSIIKGILTIAIPVMVMNVAASLFNIIDMTVLKTFGGAVGAPLFLRWNNCCRGCFRLPGRLFGFKK